MKLFRPEELEQLVCGRRELDFSALQGAAKYDNGFGPDTPARPPPVGAVQKSRMCPPLYWQARRRLGLCA